MQASVRTLDRACSRRLVTSGAGGLWCSTSLHAAQPCATSRTQHTQTALLSLGHALSASSSSAAVRQLWPRRGLACQSTSDAHDSESTDSDSAVGLRKNFSRPAVRKPLTKQAAALLMSDGSEATWREMDEKLNKYPSKRTFTAIGTGGDTFKQDITKAVEGVVGPLPPSAVSERPSSGGQYLSVRLTVDVQSPDQVISVYAAIKKSKQLKWCM